MNAGVILEAIEKGFSSLVNRLKKVNRLGKGRVLETDDWKRNEEALKEAYTKYRIVADNTYDWEYWVNPEGQYVYVSPSCRRISGYGAEEFLANPRLLQQIVHPEDRAQFDHHWKYPGDERSIDETEFRIICRDDSTRWIGHVCQPVYGENGQFLGRRGSNRSITKRKRAEQQLREKDAEIEFVADTTPVILTRLSRDLRYVFVNRACAEMFGRPREEIVGKHIVEIMGKEAFETIRPYVERVLQGEPVEYEMEIPYQGIARRFMHVAYVPERNDHGEVVGWIATIQDVTERKRIEEALRESEERFRAVFESSSDCILVWDRQYNYLYANQAAIDHVGTTRDKVIGKNMRDGLGHIPDFMQLWMGRVDRVFATGESFRVEDAVPVGDRLTYSESQVSPIRDAAGQVFAVGVVYCDVTERKRAEEALSKSREDLDRAQEVGQIGSWRMDVHHNVLKWSDENHRIFGVPKGTPMTYETFLGIVHPDDRQYVDTQWETGLRGEPYDIEHRIIVNGQIKWVREKAYLEFNDAGGLLGGFGITQDITELKQAEEGLIDSNRRLEILAETASRLLISSQPQMIVNELCRKIMTHLNCQVFFNYLVDGGRDRLRLNAWDGIPEETAHEIGRLDFDDAICGCAAREGRRIVVEHIFETQDPRTDLVRSFGIKAYACHPLMFQGRVIGTLSFGTRTRPTFAEDELALMHSVTDQVSMAIERMRYIEDLKATREDLQKSHDALEVRVLERTEELRQTVARLQAEATERLRAEKALRLATAYNRSLIEASLDPLVTIDPEGKITDVNAATEHVTGYSREDLIGTDFSNYFTEPERAGEVYRRVFQEGTVRDYALEIHHRDGDVIPVLYNATVYHDGVGKVAGVFAAARDISERLEAEKKLRDSNEQLRALTSQLVMAEESARRRIAVDLHDHVSQSLAVAKLRLETLREKASEYGLQEPVKEIRELINESIQQTRSLVTELSPSVLYELGFAAAVEWLTEQMKIRYGVNIELKNDLQIRRLDQDIQILLFQGVRELLLNIIKHAKANHASISIGEIGDHIRIRVMDDGVGFDKTRLGYGMDREGGFGLFSLRERLEHFGGRLDIDTRPGKGTSVTVEAPHKKRKKAQRRLRHVH